MGRPTGRSGDGVPDQVGQQVELRQLALGWIARLQLIEMIVAHDSSNLCLACPAAPDGGDYASQRLRRL
jgi:hypothetical protein